MQRLADPVQHLLASLESGTTRWVIALAGLPGAGKSTRAEKWVAAVNEITAVDSAMALGMDGFHLSKAQLARMPDPEAALRRRGAPWTFDARGFARKVRALKSAATQADVYWPGFTHQSGDPLADACRVPASCRLVIIEGLYTLYRDGDWGLLQGCFDESWYLDTSRQTALARLRKRHQQVWGISETEAGARIESNDRHNARIVASTRSRADWLIADER